MKTILSTLLMASCFGASAQFYTFSHANNTYADLANPILLSPDNEVWDDPEYNITFPFSFEYFGVNTNQFYGSEGLGADLYGSIGGITSALLPVLCDVIDLGYMTEDPQSTIAYQIEGAEGSRILKVQWKNVGFYEDVTENDIPTNDMNFQVWFYEGSHRIEIRFGSSNISSPMEVFGNSGPGIMLIRTVNFDTEVITPSYYLTGNPASPTMSLTTDFTTIISSHLDAMPANGQTYIFTPTTTGPVSIDEMEQPIALSIYPNPATDAIQVNNPSNVEVSTIEFLDVSGRLVKSINATNAPISISDLNAGQYFVKITSALGVATSTLTKF